jgi:TPR repeat protein
MQYGISISHGSMDKTAADAVRATLEANGIQCFMVKRDGLPNEGWANAVHEAIDQSRLLVLVSSSQATEPQHLDPEITAAVSRGLPILTVRIREMMNPRELEQHLRQLASKVKTLLEIEGGVPVTDTHPAPRRTLAVPALQVLCLLLGIVASMFAYAWWAGRGRNSRHPPAQASSELLTSQPTTTFSIPDTPAVLDRASPLETQAKWNAAQNGDAAALKRLRVLGERGDVSAMNDLGFMYAYGRGVPRDDAEAVSWYRRSSELGSALGMTSLAYMLEAGRGVARDNAEALRLYHKAADAGDPGAEGGLAMRYLNGDGVARDPAEALRWAEKGAKNGSSWSMGIAGRIFETGAAGKQDDGVAFGWYRSGAQRGDPGSMYWLGLMYANGRGTAKDLTEARKWMSKGADEGIAEAKDWLVKNP